MSHPAYIYPAFLHMECKILGCPSQTVTPLSPGRGGARGGAAGVRRVCGMSVGPSESDMSMSALRLFHINIEG